MEEQKIIESIQKQVEELKAGTDLLTQLSQSKDPEKIKAYREQIEVVKHQLNELGKLTLLLNVESLMDRVREYGPKAEEKIESFSEDVFNAFKSFMEGSKETFRSMGKDTESPSDRLSKEQAQALYQEYRNLTEAGFSEAQAFEIIRARSMSRE